VRRAAWKSRLPPLPLFSSLMRVYSSMACGTNRLQEHQQEEEEEHQSKPSFRSSDGAT
jgi:hypothetical protein